ncbi:MAG TPA: protein kinase [Acidobacteriaceae bacterium]
MLHSSERWKSIESLFHECLDLPAQARPAFLQERCGADLDLRRELEALLKSADEPLEALEQPVRLAARELAEGALPHVAPGQRLRHYEVLSMLGAGGMGEVFLARDTLLERKVALKILSPALDRDPRGLRRFEQEARAASALNHPNILTIYEFGRAEGIHFIASEYIEGETLRQRLSHAALPVADAVSIAIQIAQALEAAHASNIVHRDIKPENVMIRPDGLVKVLDFGIAKLNPGISLTLPQPVSPTQSISLSLAGLVIGSARYMSPEQARGLPVDARSDLFSLGVVLYEMVAGVAPFAGDTVSDVIAEILKGSPPRLKALVPAVPPALDAIVNRALCRDRDGRYQTAAGMLEDLQAFASHAAPARSSGPFAPPARFASSPGVPSAQLQNHPRSSRMTWAAAAILLVAVAGIWFAARMRKESAADQPPRTLAVMPFLNLRQDPSLDYLDFSLSDAITTELSSVSALILRPSSSVEKYRNQIVDVRKAAADLKVDALLTGSYLKDGDHLRINAQLIDVRSNRILWQDSMDLEFARLLEVQDRVSNEIVKGLELHLSPAETQGLNPQRPENALAYQYYLRGIDFYALGDYPSAIAMLEKSANLDSGYAPTFANLGKAYTTSATLRLGGRDQYDRAQAAFARAMALNPELVEPRIYMANMLTDTGRVEEAVPLLRTALAATPNNAELHWELGYAYRFAGMLTQSLDEGERARQIDPQVKISSSALNSYLYLGQYEQFLRSLPDQETPYLLFYRGLAEFYEGRTSPAAFDFDRAYMLQPALLPARVGKALSDGIAGHRTDARNLLNQTEDEMEQRGVTDPESMYKVAQAFAVLGDQAAALHALSHTIDGGFFCVACFTGDPLLKSLRGQAEYAHLLSIARQRHDAFQARFFPAGQN